MQVKDWVIIALGVLAVAAVLWNRRWISRAAREVPETSPRFVKHLNDPDSSRVYQVLGPAETEGFLRVAEAGGGGGEQNVVAESQVVDVYGYDPSAVRMMKLVEAQLKTPRGVPSGRESHAEPEKWMPRPFNERAPQGKPTTSMRMLNYERGLMQIYRYAEELESDGWAKPEIPATLRRLVDEAFGKSGVTVVTSTEPVLVEED